MNNPNKKRLRRTMMFLNAQKPGLIKDPYIYKPDSIMLDLEDAVAENQKDAARFSLYHALKTINYRGCERVVRINGLDSPYWKEDIRCSVAGGCDSIRIPKTESAQDVKLVEREIAYAEKEFGRPEGSVLIMAAVESARGVMKALDICESSERLFGIALSGGDYTKDFQTHITGTGIELMGARQNLVIAARAAGVQCFDTVYTDQLSYTQGLNSVEKGNYDAGVRNYGYMLENCDGAITSTNQLQEELYKYQSKVLLNRNLASDDLIAISSQYIKDYSQTSDIVKIGYFSGSISHNENFELIKPAIKQLLTKYSNVQLHIVGILDIPQDMKPFENQIVTHDYVDWDKLPALISEVDINLAPLVDSIFNRAKSEIKWIEAALVKVPTVASKIGAFSDAVVNGETGLLATDDQWFDKLEALVLSPELRQKIADAAYRAVLENCTLSKKDDMVTYFEQN